MNTVTLNQRDIDFLLYEFLDTESLLSRERYAEHSRESFDATINGAKNIAEKYYANHYHKGDVEEPVFDGDSVTLIPEIQAAWDATADFGLLSASYDFDEGGCSNNFMFSHEVKEVTKGYMNNIKEISVARMNVASENVKHVNYIVQARDRYEVIKRVSDMNPDIYGIVFCRTRRETKDVANKLMNDNYNADTLHGDLSQAQRDDVMNRFRKRQIQILVATDVAARGLDIPLIQHVINYDLPQVPEDYVHRIGRTARAGSEGCALTFLTKNDRLMWNAISRLINPNYKEETTKNLQNYKVGKKNKNFHNKKRRFRDKKKYDFLNLEHLNIQIF